ncbi:uncharacterized protein [Eurosta solidaginis]|uniref:uncharacterized protein n=1 Tax=Eurosta solidaginis TaxID=178769 RepID=UPI0035305C7D
MTGFSVKRTKTEQRVDSFTVSCRLCQKNHGIRLCPRYRGMSAEERLRAVLIHRHCPNCLSPFHRLEICPSNDRCHRCREPHHTTLHMEDEQARPRPIPCEERDDDESDEVLSINLTEDTRSWAQQVEEEEKEMEECTRGAAALAIAPTASGEARSFRPLLQHEKQKSNQRHMEHGDGAETRPFRPSHRNASGRRGGAEPRPFRSTRLSTGRAAPYPPRKEGTTTTLARQATTPAGFRSGRLRDNLTAPTITRALIAIAPTAIVRIEAGGRLHLVRALLDACAPTSIIDANLCKDLHLERNNTARLSRCTIVLRGKYGVAGKITTQATVISNYARLNPTANLDPSVAAPFQFMKLADPTFYRSSPVLLTLGADVYANIMVGGTPASTVGGLLTQATIFGLVVSGAHPL